MTDLAELLARVESAGGPDRELDGLLWAWQDDRSTRYADGMLLARNNKAPHDECIVGYVDPGKTARNFYTAGQTPPIPRYSASLDDSIALCERVLPEWRPEIGKHLVGFHVSPYWKATLRWWEKGTEAKAATPALALCAAILKAVASRGQS